MDSSWSEVQQICDPNLSKVSAVSALCWDPYHELLWAGNDSVRETMTLRTLNAALSLACKEDSVHVGTLTFHTHLVNQLKQL